MFFCFFYVCELISMSVHLHATPIEGGGGGGGGYIYKRETNNKGTGCLHLKCQTIITIP